MKTPPFWLLIVICLLAVARTALAYLVGPALPLDKLTAEADLIFKGEAVATEPVQDEWFKPVAGYAARETRFKIISQIKGDFGGGEVRFRHYDEEHGDGFFRGSYTPQFYHFEKGRSYIIFANKTATGGRQTRSSHTMKMDLGALRCRDASPVAGRTLPEIYWAELIALRDSPVTDDVAYAIRQLGEMSESPEGHGTVDFSRLETLTAMHRLISRPEPEIAQAAISMVGAGSPYLTDQIAPYWLATVGAPNPGLGPMNPGTRNAGGALSWRELVAVANGKAPPETRALAIRAMGLVKASELRQIMDPWLKAPEPPVRAAAVLLFTDFAVPHEYTTGQFAGFARDPSPEVRKCAAYAIGFVQNPEILPVLGKLIKDEDAAVRRAALESLHSFHPQIPAVAAALKANLENVESQPLSLLALARENPGAHLDALARVIEEKTSPANWSGGEIPAFTAWKILFKHLRTQPPADVRAGKWDRYLDALEKVGNYGSSEPQYIYAFYLHCGMTERAVKYRAAAKKAASYDLDPFFDMVDKNPASYLGN